MATQEIVDKIIRDSARATFRKNACAALLQAATTLDGEYEVGYVATTDQALAEALSVVDVFCGIVEDSKPEMVISPTPKGGLLLERQVSNHNHEGSTDFYERITVRVDESGAAALDVENVHIDSRSVSTQTVTMDRLPFVIENQEVLLLTNMLRALKQWVKEVADQEATGLVQYGSEARTKAFSDMDRCRRYLSERGADLSEFDDPPASAQGAEQTPTTT